MRSVLLLLVSLLLANRTAQGQFYRIGLHPEKLQVPAGPWQVAQVLDLRADRSRLGAVREGFNNEVTSANFAQPLAAELQQLFEDQVPVNSGARPVVMRVFTLALSESIRGGAEHAEAELVADFLEQQADSTFRVLLAVGETTQHDGLDVTRHHAANLALLLQEGLRQLAALPLATPAPETLSRADALAGRGGATSPHFAIQTAAAPKRGFYATFREWRDNAPGEPDYPFAVEHIPHPSPRWAGTDEVQAAYLRTDAKHQRTLVSRNKIWGLSDGKEMLIAYQGSFYKLRPAADGRNFTFLGPPLSDEQTASKVAAAAVLGGALGAAIAGAAANAGPPTQPYEVHLASGRVLPVPEPRQPVAAGVQKAPDTARVYVFRRADSPEGRAVALHVNGQAGQGLPACQWAVLRWTDRRREMTICAQPGTTPDNCHSFVPDFSQPSYFECVVPADGSPPMLVPVAAKAGAFEIRRIRLLTAKRR